MSAGEIEIHAARYRYRAYRAADGGQIRAFLQIQFRAFARSERFNRFPVFRARIAFRALIGRLLFDDADTGAFPRVQHHLTANVNLPAVLDDQRIRVGSGAARRAAVTAGDFRANVSALFAACDSQACAVLNHNSACLSHCDAVPNQIKRDTLPVLYRDRPRQGRVRAQSDDTCGTVRGDQGECVFKRTLRVLRIRREGDAAALIASCPPVIFLINRTV